MYVTEVPNRNSPPAILLRESFREAGKVKNRTIANLTKWKPERIEALKRALRGDFDDLIPLSDFQMDRVFGLLYALKRLAEKLGITKALGKSAMGKLALFLVLARVAHQGSRYSAARWAQEHCVAEVLGLESFDENHLYAALDWLSCNQEEIEHRLYQDYVKRSGSPPALVLYDVTSSYVEGECNELAAFGYNRDKKKGKKQIVIGLLTSDDGEPLAVRVFEGNTSDPKTVKEQIHTLKNSFGIKDVIFVGDRGMVKTKGKQALRDEGFKYITALTNSQARKLLKQQVIQIGLFDTEVCQVQHGSLRLILRKNPATADKENRRRNDKLDKLIHLVTERNDFVRQSKRADAEAGMRRIEAWSVRHKVNNWVCLELEDRLIKVTVDEDAKADAALLDGCYILETDVDCDVMSPKTVDQRYRDLHMVERNFRRIKTGLLEIRPVYVRKSDRTRGHVLATMMALKIVRETERLLKNALPTTPDDIHTCTVQDVLHSLSRVCLLSCSTDQGTVFQLPKLDEHQKTIFTALHIRPPKFSGSSPL